MKWDQKLLDIVGLTSNLLYLQFMMDWFTKQL